MHLKHLAHAVAAATLLATPSFAIDGVSTDFSNGAEGWTGPQGVGGATTIDLVTGTPAPSLRTVFNNFGITFANDDAAWTGDYTTSPFSFSVDVDSQVVGGFFPATRDMVLELRDYDNPPTGFPYVSVFYDLGDISTGSVTPTGGVAGSGFVNLAVTVEDPTQADLPTGWGGYGAENPVTFEPELPAGRTFANVLAGVDEVALTTLTPGFFFSFNDYNVALDNPTITLVPEPTSAMAALIGAGVFLRRRR